MAPAWRPDDRAMLAADQPLVVGDWTFQPTFEHRLRWERRLDRDFVEDLPDNTTEWLFRTRLGFIAKDKKGSRIVFVYQRGYNDQTVSGRLNPIHSSDVTQFYWEGKVNDWTLTLGRWPYRLGDGRLISSQGTWGNLGRTFEGVLARSSEFEAAVFGEATNTPSNQDITTALVSAKTQAGQTSLLYKQNDRTALDTKIYTLNHLWKKNSGPWTWTLEGSYQWGKNNGVDHDAFALTAQADRSFGPRFKGYIEASIASGGSGSKSRAFDPLYQNANPPYGLRSQVGFRNLAEVTVGGTWQADPKLKVEGLLTFVNLYDSKDAWYGISGGVNRRSGGSYLDPTGSSGREVGRFFHLEALYSLSSRDSIGAGFGLFFPGGFVKSQLNRPTEVQTWGYVMYQIKL